MDQAEKAKDQAGRILDQLKSVLEYLDYCGDFSNGVTDPTGSIDEGRVYANRFFGEAHRFVRQIEAEMKNEN